MSTERRDQGRPRDDEEHDEQWRTKIQRALRDLRAHGLPKDYVSG